MLPVLYWPELQLLGPLHGEVVHHAEFLSPGLGVHLVLHQPENQLLGPPQGEVVHHAELLVGTLHVGHLLELLLGLEFRGC